MVEIGVKHHRHIGAQSFQHPRRVAYAWGGDVRIAGAAAEEGGGPLERPRVVAFSPGGPEEPATQADHAAEAAGVAGGVLQSQASTLRESEQHRALGWD